VEVMVLPVKFDFGALLRDNKRNWIYDFSSNKRRGMHFFELFSVYNGLMLVINNFFQQIIYKIYILEVLHLLHHLNHLHQACTCFIAKEQ